MGPTFVQDLAVVAAVAGLTAAIARWLGQSTILGYLAAGFVVGPYVPIPLMADKDRVHALAEFGVILVMFAVGLEFRVRRLLALLPKAGPVALFQVGALGWAGATLGRLIGLDGLGPVFLGAGLSISSTMVVSRVFDTVKVERSTRDLVFGVLVVQDVVAIVLVAVLTAVAAGAEVSTGAVAAMLAKLAGALLGLGLLGVTVLPRILPRIVKLGSAEATLVASAGVGFGAAGVATSLGYSSALGAFVGGVLVAEAGVGEEVEPLVRPVRDLFAAVFFVSVGMEVDPVVALWNLPAILVGTALVIGGQLASVTAAGVLAGSGLRSSVAAGLSLGQVGEFGFLLGAIGVAAGAGAEVPAILVGVALLTSFTTPILVARAPKVVAELDRRLPPRVAHLLSAYESWMKRSQTTRNRPWRGIRVVALDVVGAVATVLCAATWREEGTALAESVGVPAPWSRWVVPAAAALIVGPLAFGAVRSTRILARNVAAEAVPEGTAGGEAVRRLLETAVQVMVLLGAGLPVVAVVRPFLGPAGDALALIVFAAAVLGNQLWRRAYEADMAMQSGAEELAKRLLRSPEDSHHSAPSLPEVAGVAAVPIRPGHAAVGQTLRALGLRARSGATVVTLSRKGRDAGPPGVEEPLLAGDLLGLLGSDDDLRRARAILATGDVPDDPTAEGLRTVPAAPSVSSGVRSDPT